MGFRGCLVGVVDSLALSAGRLQERVKFPFELVSLGSRMLRGVGAVHRLAGEIRSRRTGSPEFGAHFQQLSPVGYLLCVIE